MIFKPLLVEMETYNEDLDKDEFIDSAMSLLETLDINQRNTVLNFGKKVPRNHAYFNIDNRFKPDISKKSRKIADQKNMEMGSKNLLPEERF